MLFRLPPLLPVLSILLLLLLPPLDGVTLTLRARAGSEGEGGSPNMAGPVSPESGEDKDEDALLAKSRINSGALRSKFELLRSQLPPRGVKIAVVVKNVARPVQVALALQRIARNNLELLATENAELALEMRAAGVTGRLAVLYPVKDMDMALALAAQNIEATVSSLTWLQSYGEAAAAAAATAGGGGGGGGGSGATKASSYPHPNQAPLKAAMTTAVLAYAGHKSTGGAAGGGGGGGAGGMVAPLKVHLVVDTGLGREGAMADAAMGIGRALSRQTAVKLVGVMTHLCCEAYESKSGEWSDASFYKMVFGAKGSAGMESRAKTTSQLDRFDAFLLKFRGEGLLPADALVHAASSGAVVRGVRRAFYDMVRVGRVVVDGITNLHDLDAILAGQAWDRQESVSVKAQAKLKAQAREKARAEAQEKAQTTPGQPLPPAPSKPGAGEVGHDDTNGECTQSWVAVKKRLPKGWCVGYGCMALDNLQFERGPLERDLNVIYLGGNCVSSLSQKLTLEGMEQVEPRLILCHTGGGGVAVIDDDAAFALVKEDTRVVVGPKDAGDIPLERRE